MGWKLETVWKRLIQFTNRNFFPMSSVACEWASERTNKLSRARVDFLIGDLFKNRLAARRSHIHLSKNESTIVWYHGMEVTCFALHRSLDSEVTSKSVWWYILLSLWLFSFFLSFLFFIFLSFYFFLFLLMIVLNVLEELEIKVSRFWWIHR